MAIRESAGLFFFFKEVKHGEENKRGTDVVDRYPSRERTEKITKKQSGRPFFIGRRFDEGL